MQILQKQKKKDILLVCGCLFHSVWELKNQQGRRAIETKMCSFVRLLVSLRTLLSAVLFFGFRLP